MERFFDERAAEGVRFLDPARDAPLGVGVKYDRNPVLLAPDPTHHICHPQVVREGDLLYMFYVHYDAGRPPGARLDLATSADGVSWRNYEGNPVLAPTEGAWDGTRVSYHSILRVGDTWRLYYTGTDAQGPRGCRIGLATSKDLYHWVKHPDNPLLSHPESPSDGKQVQVPCICLESGIFHLFYMEQDGPSGGIAAAVSPDGIRWTRDSRSPVLRTEPGAWDSLRISPQRILRYEDRFHLFYNGYTGMIYGAGIAISTDLRDWRKYEGNPTLTVAGPGSWESLLVDHQDCKPFGGRYWVWYSGADGTSQHIGLAFLAERSGRARPASA